MTIALVIAASITVALLSIIIAASKSPSETNYRDWSDDWFEIHH